MKKRLAVALLMAFVVVLAFPSVGMAKTRTKLSIAKSSSYEHFDRAPYISGTLKSSSGRALKDKRVKLYCGTRYVGSKRTDVRGRVRFPARLPGTLLTGKWKLKYAESSRYYSSTSVSRATQVHIHYLGPAELVDDSTTYLDEAGNTRTLYLLRVRTPLEAGHKYIIESSLPAVGIVGLQGGDVTLYTTTDPVKNFTFTAPDTVGYSFLFSTSGEYGYEGALDVAIW